MDSTTSSLPGATFIKEDVTIDESAPPLAVSNPYPAPELTGIESWINSSGETLEDLKGKVVVIDFWTYSCINCIRTLPYLTEWDKKYRDDGLVILGIQITFSTFFCDFGSFY